ncbi:related to TRZ1-tRNase Z, involved in RNA processing [Sporisorium reilianum f. sp. reilianum]|uniref:ribonuclease Z n=1 Tax=Sporisorium reilianum f. sp. reilianum TaxID=72559 RepID=A0A2N8UGD6_9BASI|nr:related to TRZ1-tRNase Z, involved in RNA processing [Sporisorium reilianum f. sp. reilianum]
MLADLRVLHVPSSDTNVLPPVILQFGADRYLFNVGEGVSRSSTQRKANLSRVSNIFVSRVGWEAIGGLPGVLMSMADGQRSTESLHGPDGLRYALATMRTYAKRDIMKLVINEIPAHAGPSNTAAAAIAQPFFTDDNLAIHAISLSPASAIQPASKKQKVDSPRSSASVSAAILEKVDQLWRKPYFNPSSLEGEEARAWIHLISDSIFNDSLLRKRQQQASATAESTSNSNSSRQLVSSAEDVEMQDADQPQAASSSQARGHSPWRPPLSPAFVTRLLPRPENDTRNLSADRSDPAEGGQAPVLAFICEAHAQRGKFDPVKATEAGVPPGPSFAALTKAEDVSFKRPVSWSSMPADERKRWIQSQRGAQRGANANGKGKGKDIKDAAPPAAWNDLEQVTVKSTDVMGPSRAGAVAFHIYLPSVDYVDDLLSDRAASTFSPYTLDANRHLNREQSRTPHAIVHAVPLDVLHDARYQAWMRRFGPDCHHIVANHDVCANKLMFPSSTTIPLRLSKLDELMFKVPQYQLTPRVPVSTLAKPASTGKAATANDFPLKLVAAEADQVIPLQPRGEAKRFHSGAPDFDFAIQSEQADKLAAFELEVVEETERQTEQLAKAKAKNKDSAKNGVEATAVDAGADELGAVRNVRLREARKQAWQVYLDVVKKIKADSASTASTSVPPEKDILVTTLGTGSAAPSKYRNVISTLIQTPSSGTILLDAGESTYGLLRRKFGCRRDGTAAESGSLVSQDVDDIMREMRVLFISHIHADHHIGLIRLLLERRKLEPRPEKPLYLIGTGFVHNYLEEYEQIEKLGLDEDVVLVLNDHLDHATGVDPNPDAGASLNTTTSANANGNSRGYQQARREHVSHMEAIKQVTGLSHIHTARVVHRGSHCYGLVLRHTTEDWSVAYSGDTRPAPELIAAGKGCKLLIHEATLEDGELEMAIGKGHSTFGEAIRVGHEMGAHNLLLTHFSQRYPKMARSSLFALSEQGGQGGKNVPIALAFDMVTYPLSQFSKIQGYTPAMEALFAADTEGDDEAQSVVGEEKEAVTSSSKAGGNGKQSSKKQANGSGAKGSSGAAAAAAAAGTLGIVATNQDTDSKAAPADVDKADHKPPTAERPRPTARYVRKGMKPSEWRYLGLRLSPSSSSTTALPTILPTYVLELVQTAQTSTMGAAGGAYNVDVLSVHVSNGASWDAVLRVEARHGQELATCLSMLPSPSVHDAQVRLSVVGPTTAVQTLHNLLC